MAEKSDEDRELEARLHRLGTSLDSQKQAESAALARQAAAEKAGGDAGKAMSLGFRVLAELIAGILVGLAIGWQLDRWFSTGPWLMILFLFFGTAAGILNVVRAAARGPA